MGRRSKRCGCKQHHCLSSRPPVDQATNSLSCNDIRDAQPICIPGHENVICGAPATRMMWGWRSIPYVPAVPGPALPAVLTADPRVGHSELPAPEQLFRHIDPAERTTTRTHRPFASTDHEWRGWSST